MSLLTIQNGSKKPTNKTVFRNTTRCLKLTEEEARLVDEVATAKGVPRSEWMRDVILRELRCYSLSNICVAATTFGQWTTDRSSRYQRTSFGARCHRR